MKNNASLIKELKDRTDAGFVECKKALEATNYDIDEAIKFLQESGAVKAAKTLKNVAAEGLVNIVSDDKHIVIYEINCQTDFVALNEDFKKLVQEVGEILLNNDFKNFNEVSSLKNDNGDTIEKMTMDLAARIGEKISFRRAVKINVKEGNVKFGSYVHFDGRTAALFVGQGNESADLKGIAMHISSMNPLYLKEEDVPAEIIAEINESIKANPALIDKDPSKPKSQDIKDKIAKGLYESALEEKQVLLFQEYVVEGGKTVGKYLDELKTSPIAMVRFEVGEGIEKNEVSFADEVKSQMTN